MSEASVNEIKNILMQEDVVKSEVLPQLLVSQRFKDVTNEEIAEILYWCGEDLDSVEKYDALFGIILDELTYAHNKYDKDNMEYTDFTDSDDFRIRLEHKIKADGTKKLPDILCDVICEVCCDFVNGHNAYSPLEIKGFPVKLEVNLDSDGPHPYIEYKGQSCYYEKYGDASEFIEQAIKEKDNKHTIWSSEINIDDWKDYIEEELRDRLVDDILDYRYFDYAGYKKYVDEYGDNGLRAFADYVSTLSADDIINSYPHYCTENIFNIETQGDIICIADIGRWYGRAGYSYEGDNIKNIFHTHIIHGMSEIEFYVELEGNTLELKADEHHRDGTNHYVYRELKPNISDSEKEEFESLIYNDECEYSDIEKYTRPLGQEVQKAYGLVNNIYNEWLNFDAQFETSIRVDEDGHGFDDAPYEYSDVLTDMRACESNMEKLHQTLHKTIEKENPSKSNKPVEKE